MPGMVWIFSKHHIFWDILYLDLSNLALILLCVIITWIWLGLYFSTAFESLLNPLPLDAPKITFKLNPKKIESKSSVVDLLAKRQLIRQQGVFIYEKWNSTSPALTQQVQGDPRYRTGWNRINSNTFSQYGAFTTNRVHMVYGATFVYVPAIHPPSDSNIAFSSRGLPVEYSPCGTTMRIYIDHPPPILS